MSSVVRRSVLLLGFGDAGQPLGSRLHLMHFRGLRAETVEEAVAVLAEADETVRAALVPVPPPFAELRPALDRVRKAAPGIDFVAMGERPPADQESALRAARVRFALWEAAHDGALRFVLNQVVAGSERRSTRGELRVPTTMIARVFSAAGEKPALVYNLSEGGAYLETHRPTMSGGHVRVELPLPAGKRTLEAVVVSTNVPGNLQRPNLPLGMGVRFDQAEEQARREIARYVEERAAQFRL